MLNAPAVSAIRHEDGVGDNSASPSFQAIERQVATGGVLTYGRGIGGVLGDPNAGMALRFTVKRPGRYEFKSMIHPDMRGELLLLNTQAV